MRNRGKKLFHKIRETHSSNITNQEKDIYFTLRTGEKVILLRGNSIDKYGTPACPLIMAAYSLEQEKQDVSESMNIYYVDIDNIKNIPNHLVIEKGVELAKDLGCHMKIKNIYITNTGILKNFQNS